MSVINGLWVEGDLTNLEILSIKSFLANGHDYHLYSYQHPSNPPRGVKLCDGRELLPDSSIFVYKQGRGAGSVSAFSNLFRYTLLHEKGGYWTDTDVICLQPFDFNEDFVFGQERTRDGQFKVASCVIKTPAKSPLTQFCLEECSKVEIDNLQWGEIGPILVTRAVNQFGLQHLVKPPEAFCPSDWWKVDQEIVGSLGGRVELGNSYAVHLWNEMWRRNGFMKNDKHHSSSLYNLLKARYTI